MDASDWEQRVAATWQQLDELTGAQFRSRIDDLAAAAPDPPLGDFERACAFDSTGHSDRAVPLYRRALDGGLSGIRRRRAVIQLASSMRNIGEASASVEALQAERQQPSDELDDAVAAFLALALADLGQEREALALTLAALAPHLPRYQRSVTNYASELLAPPS